jgi:hypothetical protein
VLALWGVDPVLVLFGGIGFILVPIELGYLALEARRTTGSWSPLKVVNYKERVPGGRLALLAGGTGYLVPARPAGVYGIPGRVARAERVLLVA